MVDHVASVADRRHDNKGRPRYSQRPTSHGLLLRDTGCLEIWTATRSNFRDFCAERWQMGLRFASSLPCAITQTYEEPTPVKDAPR
jgi:hypothetical protein